MNYQNYQYYNLEDATNKIQVAQQRGFPVTKGSATAWKLNPKVGFYLPLGLGYQVLHVGPDYSWVLTAVPSRAQYWIMTKKRPSPKGPEPWPGDVPVKAMPASTTPKEGEDTLTKEEEDVILRQALLKAESLGCDISQVRIAAWDPTLPFGPQPM